MNRRFALFLVCALWSGLSASAQNRVRYEDLARNHRDPAWHIRTVAVHGNADSMQVLTSFRIAYSAIPFRRIPGSDSLRAEISLTLDFLTVTDAPARRRSAPEPPVSMGRRIWMRTLVVPSADVADESKAVSDMVTASLPRGPFRVLPRVEIDGVSRQTPVTEPVTPATAVLIPIDASGDALHLGSNMRFGEPAVFRVITAPGTTATRYSLFSMNALKSDSTIWESGSVEGDRIVLSKSHLENSTYRIHLFDAEGNRLGGMEFLPRWYGMPAGLLNLDIAIDLMRFTLGRDEWRAMRRGNAATRERAFRDWWAQRDPTPDTPYNELMSEYFRRIDHAFRTFTTPTVIGYESDMGKVWIRNGKPDHVERRFPAGSPAVEVWDYGNRRFIFRATTGFGDFELVSTP